MNISMNVASLILICLLVGCTESSKEAYFESNYDKLNTAIKIFYIDCDRYPSDLQELNERERGCENWRERKYGHLELQDAWGRDFQYQHPPKNRKENSGLYLYNYDLYSSGQDGVLGTDDDIGTWLNPKKWRDFYNK